MADQAKLDAVIKYLQTHRNSYKPEALRQELLRNEIEPDLIEQAFARVYGTELQAEPTPDRTNVASAERTNVESAAANAERTNIANADRTNTESTTTSAERTNVASAERTNIESSTTPEDNSATATAAAATSLQDSGVTDQVYLERIRSYLEQHRATYDRNALRQKLLSDGHDARAVDLAITQVYGYQVPQTTLPATKSSVLPLVLTIIGIFLFNYTLLPFAAAMVNTIPDIDQTVGVALFGLGILAEIVASVALRKRNRAVSRGIAYGLLASIVPIVVITILIGICFAALGAL